MPNTIIYLNVYWIIMIRKFYFYIYLFIKQYFVHEYYIYEYFFIYSWINIHEYISMNISICSWKEYFILFLWIIRTTFKLKLFNEPTTSILARDVTISNIVNNYILKLKIIMMSFKVIKNTKLAFKIYHQNTVKILLFNKLKSSDFKRNGFLQTDQRRKKAINLHSYKEK